MGEFADCANDEQIQSLEDLMDYESGAISAEEAMARGIIDEDESLPNITVWGVHDADSLASELVKCDLILANYELRKRRKAEQMWCSNGKVYRPQDMTTLHLENAIRYANRNQISGSVVDAMVEELANRKSDARVARD